MMTSFGFKKSPWLFLIFALNMVCLLADNTTENELDSSLTTGDSITNTTSQILGTAEFDANSTVPDNFGLNSTLDRFSTDNPFSNATSEILVTAEFDANSTFSDAFGLNSTMDSSLTGDSMANTTFPLKETTPDKSNTSYLTITSTVASQNLIINTGAEGMLLNFSEI